MVRNAPPTRLSELSTRVWSDPNFALGTLSSITLFHDYLCPWCWVGFFQAKKLTDEFGVTFDWVGAELYPPELDGPASRPGPRPAPDEPQPKTRFDLFCDTEGIALPTPSPGFVRTHAALLGAEWAKSLGQSEFDRFNEAVYRAYWEGCEDIEDASVVAQVAARVGLDAGACDAWIRAETHAERIVPFDDGAYSLGIRHVPTFVFGAEEILAEANYVDLARATERFLLRSEKWRAK